ncbi:hypothetical protein OFC63_29255, partial [Escherichia coli]|nr:hypothetical protein [Escherichia coli]
LLAALLRTPRGRYAFHRLQLQLPGVGELMRKQAIARVATVMATLLRSGIVFERSVEIAQRSVKNLVLRDALGRLRLAVHAGRDIAPALEATGA